MFSCGREMYYLHHIHRNIFYLALFLLVATPLLPTEALSHVRGRRKQTVEEATEKPDSVPDQMAQATTHTENNQQRRAGGVFSTNVNAENYPYGNLEMNLIRPESENPIHTRITAKYRFSTKNEQDNESLEDAETAEEYVSKAMKKNIFGTRLREPINIPAQAEEEPTKPKVTYKVKGQTKSQQDYQQEQQDYLQQQQDHQYQEQQQSQQQHQQFQQGQIDAQIDQQKQHEPQQQQQPEQQQQDFIDAYESQTEQIETENGKSQQPAPVFEKDTNPYDVSSSVDRHYRTKYVYQPHREEDVRDEKTRVSASTEIPRGEIMKQIEKSVIKYMRELEAEGKIVTQAQEPKAYYQLVTVAGDEKSMGSTTTKPKLMSTTSSYHGTRAPLGQKIPVANHGGSKYHPKVHYQAETESRFQAGNSQKQQQQHKQQQQYQRQQQQQQQQQHQSQLADIADAVAPNVEFIYKIKTRTPLQTATVKTVSKPYTLPMKTTIEQFDHTAALKNMEEFDMSHVVTTEDNDDIGSNHGKPPNNKLYFNSEIYHDINSLPFKAENTKYGKIKSSGDYHHHQQQQQPIDYKGYSAGYFAEPSTGSGDREQQAESLQMESEDGYPLANPYKYVLKKEATIVPSMEDHAVANWEQQRVHGSKPLYAVLSSQKALDFDSYSPKFNNNPEGYGYQHSVKSLLSNSGERDNSHTKYVTRHTLVKRGKRGNHNHAHQNAKKIKRGTVKDIEASIALRPPPKS